MYPKNQNPTVTSSHPARAIFPSVLHNRLAPMVAGDVTGTHTHGLQAVAVRASILTQFKDLIDRHKHLQGSSHCDHQFNSCPSNDTALSLEGTISTRLVLPVEQPDQQRRTDCSHDRRQSLFARFGDNII